MYCRSYSGLLQRIITDFGADIPFGRIPVKLEEHYGIKVNASSARKITQSHGEQILTVTAHEAQSEIQIQKGVQQLIVEMDGTMIPIVQTKSVNQENQKIDRRKTRLCLVHQQNSSRRRYGATLGTVDEAGEKLLDVAIQEGIGIGTSVHGIGDGASWIANQIKKHFGNQSNYLIDFYHLCDYLATASSRCAPENPHRWFEEQKQKIKSNQIEEVLMILKTHLEAENIPDKLAPVRGCYRYMINRPGQFNYSDAIEKNLPIGSGKIESAHRYVIQERLKLSGCWWTPQKAKVMLALRVLRANGNWDNYGQKVSTNQM